MRTSEHYELNLVEGTDKVNPLVQDVPNYEKIDESMYNNKCSSIGIATELRTGTVHALTRQNEDAPVFRFTASSNYTSGDTFTVDGVQVSALLVDGTPLPNMAYIIGSEVLCVLKGTLITVFANRTTASDSDKLGGELPSYYATDSDLDPLKDVVEAHTEQITKLNSDLNDMRFSIESHVVTGNNNNIRTITPNHTPKSNFIGMITGGSASSSLTIDQIFTQDGNARCYFNDPVPTGISVGVTLMYLY